MQIVVIDTNQRNCVRMVYELPKDKTLDEAKREIRAVYESPEQYAPENDNPQPEEILDGMGYNWKDYDSIDLADDEDEDDE